MIFIFNEGNIILTLSQIVMNIGIRMFRSIMKLLPTKLTRLVSKKRF